MGFNFLIKLLFVHHFGSRFLFTLVILTLIVLQMNCRETLCNSLLAKKKTIFLGSFLFFMYFCTKMS
nr:MAG TPA: hypothetical protein [Caudoviricetes sp.]